MQETHRLPTGESLAALPYFNSNRRWCPSSQRNHQSHQDGGRRPKELPALNRVADLYRRCLCFKAHPCSLDRITRTRAPVNRLTHPTRGHTPGRAIRGPSSRPSPVLTNDVYYPEPAVTTGALLGPSRTAHVAQARHICAYLLVEDSHLTNIATAQVVGRADHTTVVNSRARIAAALPRDTRLARVLERVRAGLTGHSRAEDEGARARRDEGRRRALSETSPREWNEYRYWRLRALRAGDTSVWGGV